MRSPAFVIAGHSALKTRVRALGRLLSMRDITIARVGCVAKRNRLSGLTMKPGKNDRPGYSCERTQWVLVTGVGPLNFTGRTCRLRDGFSYSFNTWLMNCGKDMPKRLGM